MTAKLPVRTSRRPTRTKNAAAHKDETAINISTENYQNDTEGGLYTELVFGLVGPTGVDLTKICNSLASQLHAVGYETREVRLSELIHPFMGMEIQAKDEFDRISELMTLGTKVRESSKQADIIGRLGIAEIRSQRASITKNANKSPNRGVAYIVRSFKRPEEVSLYRDTYGKAFNLISVYSPKSLRVQHLARKFQGLSKNQASPEELAVKLVNRDHEEEGKLGQRLGQTFPLADFFISNSAIRTVDSHLQRFVRLVFGDPYISPTRDEQGMFFAQAAALRSLDLSRQVGAAIVDAEGEILTTGCNEVPKFGGGLYWDDDINVMRDAEQGKDSNASIKQELIEDAVRRLRQEGWLSPDVLMKSDAELAEDSLYGESHFLKNSRLFDVIEFGRAVHAEMAAITQAARLGTSIKGARLFCTTFPCHICARHIVASGIREVQFIEPYEKSRTNELFGDSISVEPQEPSPNRANFKSFVGVAPRRYMDLFALSGTRKQKNGEVLPNGSIASAPKIKRIVLTYLAVEEMMIVKIMPPEAMSPSTGD